MIPTPILLEWMKPTGARRGQGFLCFADGHSRSEWSEPAYPPYPDGEALRKLRVERALSLRQAAAILTLSPSELSAVETGRARLLEGSLEEACRRLRVRK